MNLNNLLSRFKTLSRVVLNDPLSILRIPRFVYRAISYGPVHAKAKLREISDPYRISIPYHDWHHDHSHPNENELRAMNDWAVQLQEPILISILMPVFNPNIQWLKDAIASVKKQAYPFWQLCIADDFSTDPEVRRVLEEEIALDSRIQVVFRSINGHISHSSNSALELAKGDWVALLDHDDLLPLDALAWVVRTIFEHPEAQLIYSDECKVDENEKLSNPYYKPDWNPTLIEGQNLFSHLGVFRFDLLRKVEGFRVGLEGSQDYDLLLRCLHIAGDMAVVHIPRVLYFWRVHRASTASGNSAKPYVRSAAELALTDHLKRRGENGTVYSLPSGYRVKRHILGLIPTLDILLDARGVNTRIISSSLKSLLEASLCSLCCHVKLVLTGEQLDSCEKIIAWAEIKAISVSCLVQPNTVTRPQVFQEILDASSADLILFWDAYIRAPNSTDWLLELYSQLLRPGVTAVGPKLISRYGTVSYAGMILSQVSIAIPSHAGCGAHEGGYQGRCNLIQNYSALPLSGSLFWRKNICMIGGLTVDPVLLPHWSIDLCLRIRASGSYLVFDPFSCLKYLSGRMLIADPLSFSTNEIIHSRELMLSKWNDWLYTDPAYNPNLDDVSLFLLARSPRNYRW